MIIPGISQGVCGCIYTQLSDVENEINGLYTYDREVCKVDIEKCRIYQKYYIKPLTFLFKTLNHLFAIKKYRFWISPKLGKIPYISSLIYNKDCATTVLVIIL